MTRAIVAAAVLALLVAGCSSSQGRPRPSVHAKSRHAVVVLEVPRGHFPPHGMCRVWIPGRPPGRQPRASTCAAALQAAPPGSWVIHRRPGQRDPLEVSFIDRKRAGIVVEVQFYDPDTGVRLHGKAVSRDD